MRLRVKQQKKPLENTIPLINIVFLMLIFFLFAGTIDRDVAKSIKPAETDAQSERERIASALVITAEGSLLMHEQQVSIEDVMAQAPAETPLMIVADKDLSGPELLRILADLKAQGVKDMTLITVRAAQ